MTAGGASVSRVAREITAFRPFPREARLHCGVLSLVRDRRIPGATTSSLEDDGHSRAMSSNEISDLKPVPRRRAPEAVYEFMDLLRLAHGALNRAQAELEGETSRLASRLSRQLTYLRGVGELLEHEATRATAYSGNGDQVVALPEREGEPLTNVLRG